MKIYELKIKDGEGVKAIALVSEPAIEEDWLALSEQYQFKAVDEDRRLVIGAVLVPDKPIIRSQGGENFYITFSKDTVREAAYLYQKNGNQRQANVEHELAVSGVTTVETWIVEDTQLDKTAAYGLKYTPGTWAAVMKIENEELWSNFVKTGRLRGFSIEGNFERVALSAELVEQNPGEPKDEFLDRCMSELADEYPDEKQRFAVCSNYLEAAKWAEETLTKKGEMEAAAEFARVLSNDEPKTR